MPRRRLPLIPLMLVLLALAAGLAAANQSPWAATPQTPAVPAPPEQPTVLQPYLQGRPQPELAPGLQAILSQARRDYRNGDVAAALSGYRKAVEGGDTPGEALLELSQVEMANGDAPAARETLNRLLSSAPAEPLAGRARLLLAGAEIALGNWQSALRLTDLEAAPDGLGDLVALRRAEAALELGNAGEARRALARAAMLESTNRPLLEEAGGLAERAGDLALAGELYARGARFFGWTAERTRILQAAGAAMAQAGDRKRAVEQYRTLLEVYGWTQAGLDAGVELWRLDGLTSYHAGLLALQEGRSGAARWAFAEAVAEGGEYAAAASRQLRSMEEAQAWREAYEAGSAEDYRSFRIRYPEGTYAAEARFQEGLAHYEAGRLDQALAVWEEGAARASGDHRARLLLWAGKTLSRLGREAAAEFNGLIAEPRDPRLLFQTARTLAEQGLWSPASRAAAQLAALSPGRALIEAPRAVQRLAYPAAYWELVVRESERRNLDPLLLLSLMHQESLYDPFALSISEARGLTQVIPPTGRDIAAALGRGGFSPGDLYRPPTAVEFGAWYLANQLSTFDGDPFRGLAAYNAGAGPVPRWASPDPDLFVERIDYSQTRGYVRQIYLHYALYRSLAKE